MTFAEADAQYEVIKQQLLAGALDDDQFEEQLHRLMVLDEAGLWWAKSRENGAWHFYDNSKGDWVAAEPLPKQSKALETPANEARPAATGAGESSLPKWAAVKPDSAAVPGALSPSSASAALPSTSQGAPATASSNVRDFGPMAELTGSMRVLFYILALLLPILGIILYFAYRNKQAQSDRTAARAFLILGIASIVFSCMCSTTYFLLEATMLGTGT